MLYQRVTESIVDKNVQISFFKLYSTKRQDKFCVLSVNNILFYFIYIIISESSSIPNQNTYMMAIIQIKLIERLPPICR